MAARVLYFTAEEHLLYRSTRAGLHLEARFPADEPGVAAFREHLRPHRGAHFSVLADLAGEDFHEEQIPYVRGADREAVLARRLAQRYRDTRLAATLSLGQVVASERRNERLLLASFTNTQQFAPWLDALEEAGTRLQGVYSVPLLAPALASQLGAREGRALIVSANRAGLRQCYVDGGKLRFARLERTVEMVPEALAMFVRSETQRLAQYLVTLRALPREGTPVQVVVIAPPGQRATFEQALVSDARLVFRTVDYAEALQAAKLRQVPEGAQAEALFLHLAARRPPAEQFASREDRRRYVLWQLQRGTLLAGALGFAACAMVGASRWLEVMQVRDQVGMQQAQARDAAQQYERITSTFPVTQTSTENMKVTVVEFRRIAERSAAPDAALVHVSRILEQFPQMEIDGVNWRIVKAAELAAKSAGAAPAAAAAPTAPAPAAGAPAKPPAAGDTAVLIEVSGRVNATQRNDYRGITAQVQRFAAALAVSGYEPVRTQLPFDVTSEGTLTGDIGGADSGEAPRFTIAIGRKLP